MQQFVYFRESPLKLRHDLYPSQISYLFDWLIVFRASGVDLRWDDRLAPQATRIFRPMLDRVDCYLISLQTLL